MFKLLPLGEGPKKEVTHMILKEIMTLEIFVHASLIFIQLYKICVK